MSVSDCRLFVVDDNEDNRYTPMRRLGNEVHTDLVTVSDDLEAHDRPNGGLFDRVLLDMTTPEMDGHTVLENLCSSNRLATLPVMVVSALYEIDSTRNIPTH